MSIINHFLIFFIISFYYKIYFHTFWASTVRPEKSGGPKSANFCHLSNSKGQLDKGLLDKLTQSNGLLDKGSTKIQPKKKKKKKKSRSN